MPFHFRWQQLNMSVCMSKTLWNVDQDLSHLKPKRDRLSPGSGGIHREGHRIMLNMHSYMWPSLLPHNKEDLSGVVSVLLVSVAAPGFLSVETAV